MDEDMDTIIIDDTPQYPNNVIDLDEDNSDEVVEVSQIQNYRATGRYDDVFQGNSLLAEFVDKCLELEHSEGMTRVLNRALIPAYERTTKAFRESNAFKMIFTRAICNIQNQPHLKFSHVKDLCMTLKYHSKKGYKHWAYKNISRDPVGYKLRGPRKQSKPIKNKKQGENPPQIVLSDDSDCFDVPILNLDEPEPVMILNFTNDKEKNIAGPIEVIEDENIHSDQIAGNKTIDHLVPVTNAPDPHIDSIQGGYEKEYNNKDNQVIENNQNIANTNNNNVTTFNEDLIELSDDEKDVILTTDNEMSNKNSTTNAVSSVPMVCISDEEEIPTNTDKTNHNELDLDKLLVPLKEEEFPGNDERKTLKKINDIETEIKHYKELVIKTEEEEVVNDNMFSPYIQCDRYKSKIVTLYQELCKLTGEKPVKRREVRLKPTNEKLQLPMMKLEQFINNNIGPDGNPHFPDFCDVVECVEEANEDGRLGFSKREVMKEARALFTYCGRALQKSRQRREWRHMLDLVKNGLIEDPAEHDPELMARLEANRTRAVTRETELLERYSQMNNPSSGSEEDHFDSSHPKRNSVKKRITPTTVPLPVHKVTRIVSRGNQIVEVVISEESSHENEPRKSKSSKVNDTDVLKISPCSIPIIRALAGNDISTQNIDKNKAINDNKEMSNDIQGSGNDINKNNAINDDKEMSNNIQGSENDVPVKTLETAQNSLLEPNHTDDFCYEVPLINCTVETPNVVIKTEYAHIDDMKSHDEEQESALVDIKKEYDTDGNVETTNIDIEIEFAPIEVKQEPEFVSKDLDTFNLDKSTPGNSQTFNNTHEIRGETDAEIMKEFAHIDGIQPLHEEELHLVAKDSLDTRYTDNRETINNTEETLSATNNNSSETSNVIKPSSLDILEHFLKAKVLLPRMTIKFESKDEANRTVPTNIEECNRNENNDTGDVIQGVKIKEEPCVDIQSELDELGDNFTTTIIDIQDPFLVMEISSDSEDEEMDVQRSDDEEVQRNYNL